SVISTQDDTCTQLADSFARTRSATPHPPSQASKQVFVNGMKKDKEQRLRSGKWPPKLDFQRSTIFQHITVRQHASRYNNHLSGSYNRNPTGPSVGHDLWTVCDRAGWRKDPADSRSGARRCAW